MGVGFKKTPPHKHFTSILHVVVLALERWGLDGLEWFGDQGKSDSDRSDFGPPRLAQFFVKLDLLPT